MQIYRDNFERAYIEATEAFYRVQAPDHLKENGVQASGSDIQWWNELDIFRHTGNIFQAYMKYFQAYMKYFSGIYKIFVRRT